MKRDLQVMKFAHCLRIVLFIEKYADIFRGGDFVLGLGLYRENFWWGGKFSEAIQHPGVFQTAGI